MFHRIKSRAQNKSENFTRGVSCADCESVCVFALHELLSSTEWALRLNAMDRACARAWVTAEKICHGAQTKLIRTRESVLWQINLLQRCDHGVMMVKRLRAKNLPEKEKNYQKIEIWITKNKTATTTTTTKNIMNRVHVRALLLESVKRILFRNRCDLSHFNLMQRKCISMCSVHCCCWLLHRSILHRLVFQISRFKQIAKKKAEITIARAIAKSEACASAQMPRSVLTICRQRSRRLMQFPWARQGGGNAVVQAHA